MCQLLETIKLENGTLFNLHYHQERFNRARRELFPAAPAIELQQVIQIPSDCRSGLFRCRIVYGEKIDAIEFIPQKARSFQRLKLVEQNQIDYHLKYANRDALNQLYNLREDADEIIIVKDGNITDCSIGNLVFFDGEHWYTPSTPLLAGTQRQRLLAEGKIRERLIPKSALSNYKMAGIINAFYDLDNLQSIKITNISE